MRTGELTGTPARSSRSNPSTACLARLLSISQANDRAVARGGVVGAVLRGVCAAKAFVTFGRLFLVPVKQHELPKDIRLDPVW